MASSSGENETVLVDRTKTSPTNDVDPRFPQGADAALIRIRTAIIRHRTNKDSLRDTVSANSITDGDRRSQSPVGLTNDTQTIEEIEKVLDDYERSIPSKLSHDSSNIEEDLGPSADDNTNVEAPPPAVEAPWANQLSTLRTHPGDYEPYDYHIDKISAFEKDLIQAEKSSTGTDVKYTNVEVLLLTWEPSIDDDIRDEVDTDTKALTELFKELKYTITPYAIPLVNSRNRLQRAVLNFLEKYEDSPEVETLFIIYYNGHGSIRNKASFWHPTEFAARRSDPYDPMSEQNGPTIEWNDIRKNFDSVNNQDILFIFDCCFAGAAGKHKGSSNNTKELLAACGSEDRTPAKNSFTLRLVKCFRELLKTDPVFQVGWLFEAIQNISQKPTPLHVNLNKSRESIRLKSLATPKAKDIVPATHEVSNGHLSAIPAFRTRSASSDASSQAMSVFSSDQEDRFDGTTQVTSPVPESAEPETFQYQVLITVKLKKDVLPQAKGWNLEFPSSQIERIKDVKVRSMYSTRSTLLLVTMPVRYWVLLREHPAYTFIDYVKSDDLLHPRLPEPFPEPTSTGIVPVVRSDSDKTTFDKEEMIPHLIASMLEFFEKAKSQEHTRERHPGGVAHKFQQMATKIGLHSKLESDPRFPIIRHMMQQLVVVRNDKGEYQGLNYHMHFTEITKLFELGKKSVKEAIHRASSKNEDLESTITTKIDQLEKEVMTKLESEKRGKNYGIDPRVSMDHGRPLAKSHSRSRSNVSKHAQFDSSIPEDKEVLAQQTSTQVNSRSKSVAATGIPRTDSSKSLRKIPRTDSLKSKHSPPLRTDTGSAASRPKISLWGRKHSTVSVREVPNEEKAKGLPPSSPPILL